MRSFVLSLTVLILLPQLAAGRSSKEAQEAAASLQETLGEAFEHFQAKRFKEAIPLLMEAQGEYLQTAGLSEKDEAATRAKIFRAIGRCHDQLGDVLAAKRYYAKFLGLADPNDKQLGPLIAPIRDAQIRIERVLDRTAMSFSVEPEGTEIRIDRRLVGSSPIDKVTVAPGPHQVTLWAEGYEPANLLLEVTAGATVPVLYKLSRVGEGEGSDGGPMATTGSSGPNWILVGGLGAGAVASGVVGWVLLSAASALEAEADDLAGTVGGTQDEQNERQLLVNTKYEEAGDQRNTAVVLGVLGVGALAGAAFFALAGDGKAANPEEEEKGEARGETTLVPFVGFTDRGLTGGLTLHF